MYYIISYHIISYILYHILYCIILYYYIILHYITLFYYIIYIYYYRYTSYVQIYIAHVSAGHVSFQLLLSSGITKLRCSAGAMACITRFKEPSSSMGLLKVMSGLSLEPPTTGRTIGKPQKPRKPWENEGFNGKTIGKP